QVGHTQRLLGQMPEAEKAYDRSAELYRQLSSETPARREYRRALVHVLADRVAVWDVTGQVAQAEASLHDLVSLQRQLAGDSADPEDRSDLAWILTKLSLLSSKRGKLRHAEVLAREALAIFEQRAV